MDRRKVAADTMLDGTDRDREIGKIHNIVPYIQPLGDVLEAVASFFFDRERRKPLQVGVVVSSQD